MKHYPLADLHRIRSERENAAIIKLARARNEEKMAEDRLEKKRYDHKEYLKWCEAEAERMMGDLMGKKIQRYEFETTIEQVRWNKGGEAKWLESIAEAEHLLTEARKETELALKNHRLASAAMSHITEHYHDWSKKIKLAEEAFEEQELQEVAELLYQRREASTIL